MAMIRLAVPVVVALVLAGCSPQQTDYWSTAAASTTSVIAAEARAHPACAPSPYRPACRKAVRAYQQEALTARDEFLRKVPPPKDARGFHRTLRHACRIAVRATRVGLGAIRARDGRRWALAVRLDDRAGAVLHEAQTRIPS
jgi:hypothetical protein